MDFEIKSGNSLNVRSFSLSLFSSRQKHQSEYHFSCRVEPIIHVHGCFYATIFDQRFRLKNDECLSPSLLRSFLIFTNLHPTKALHKSLAEFYGIFDKHPPPRGKFVALVLLLRREQSACESVYTFWITVSSFFKQLIT